MVLGQQRVSFGIWIASVHDLMLTLVYFECYRRGVVGLVVLVPIDYWLKTSD